MEGYYKFGTVSRAAEGGLQSGQRLRPREEGRERGEGASASGRATNKVLNHHLCGWAGDDGNWEVKEAPEGGKEGGLFRKHGSGNAPSLSQQLLLMVRLTICARY